MPCRIGLVILDKQQKQMITYSTNDVLSEMTDIKKSFDKSEKQNYYPYREI